MAAGRRVLWDTLVYSIEHESVTMEVVCAVCLEDDEDDEGTVTPVPETREDSPPPPRGASPPPSHSSVTEEEPLPPPRPYTELDRNVVSVIVHTHPFSKPFCGAD